MNKLWNRNFFLLWQGQLVSQLGVQVNAIATAFWIKHATGSATLMGLVMMVTALPAALLHPFGGVIADRYPRKWLLVACDLLCGFAVVSLAISMFVFPSHASLLIAVLFVAAACVGTLQAFFRPAVSAAIPAIVPGQSLAAANSLSQATFQISSLLGNGAGGVLFRLCGAPLLFLLDGLSYLFSGICGLFIEIPSPPRAPKKNGRLFSGLGTELREGLVHCWERPGVRIFLLMAAFQNFFFTPCVVVLPFFVEEHLKLGPDWYGYLLALLGLGGITGYLISGSLRGSEKSRGQLLWVTNILFALEVIAFGLCQRPAPALGLSFAVGVSLAFLNASYATLLQRTTAPEIAGRVFGVYGMVCYAISPVAMGLSGVLVDWMGHDIPRVYLACGLPLLAATLLASSSRSFCGFLRGEDSPRPSDLEAHSPRFA